MGTSRVAEIAASLTITYIAALAAVVLRVFSRRLTSVALAFDDYASIAAVLCATVFFAMKVYALTNGLGQHIQDIHKTTPVITTQHIMRDLWADDIPYSVGVCLAKLSILWLYWRMFKHSKIRIPIQIMAVLSVMWFIARLVMTAVQCIPIHALWDYSVKGVCPIDPAKSFIATCATHAIIDFIIVLLPVFEVAKLHLPPAQKLSVALMFTSGLLVAVAAAFQTYNESTWVFADPDRSWTVAHLTIWQQVELNLSVFACCLPVLRPAYRVLTGQSVAQSASESRKYEHSTKPSTVGSTRLGALLNKRRGLETIESDSTYELSRDVNRSTKSDVWKSGQEGGVSVTAERGGYERESEDGDGIKVYTTTSFKVSGPK